MKPKEGRMKELLRERGLDGAIVSSPENFHYVTGFGGHQHTVSRQPGFTLAVMRSDDKAPTHITTMDFEAATFRIKFCGTPLRHLGRVKDMAGNFPGSSASRQDQDGKLGR